MVMNSAPAVLRMPKLDMEFDDECYPWALHTPEVSPRWREVAPSMDCAMEEAPAELSPELMRRVCAPYFEQMCSTVSMAQLPATSMGYVSPSSQKCRAELRAVCEPFFEQMVTALHRSISQPCSDHGFQPVFYPMMAYSPMDDQSTDADDSCAFTSLFSGASSESPRSLRSEVSETPGDVVKSSMICRHWKSKGFCRLESKCKFLHPEHKCGIDVVAANDGAAGNKLDIVSRPKKRGGKNRSNRAHEQPCIEQGVA